MNVDGMIRIPSRLHSGHGAGSDDSRIVRIASNTPSQGSQKYS
jgi:hypothetical protein